MYRSAGYPEPESAVIDAFVRAQPYAVVMATDPDGHPTASLLPFVLEEGRIVVHMVQEDATFRALQATGRGSVLVEEFLAFTPHTPVSETYAGQATLHFRAVLYRVTARVTTDVQDVAHALEDLLDRYETGAPHVPVHDLATYGEDLVRLGIAELAIVDRQAKFKHAQSKDAPTRARLVDYLLSRDGWRDRHAAEVIAGVDGGGADPS